MSWKNLTANLNRKARDTFGEEVVFKGKDDDEPVTISAIFDNNYQEVDPDTGAPISTKNLMLGIKVDDLPRELETGDVFTVREVDHKVVDTQPDSEGMIKVLIHVASRPPKRRS